MPQGRRRRFVKRHFPGSEEKDISSELISQIDDDNLSQLGRFFDFGRPAAIGWPEPGLRIFASHLSSTRGRFSKLKDELASSFSANLFFAHDDIEGGAPWRQSLLDALGTMDALLAIHSPGFGASPFCNQEIGVAISRSVPIVSMMDGEEPRGFISEAQGFSHREEDSMVFIEKALNLIAKRAPGPFSEAIARSLKRAKSYRDADTLIEQLLSCDSVTTEALEQIGLAVRFNDQVYESGSGNMDRVMELAERHGVTLWSPPGSLRPGIGQRDDGLTLIKSEFDVFKV